MAKKKPSSDFNIHKKALIFTVLLHLFVFIIPSPTPTIKLTPDPQLLHVPVELVIQKSKPKPKKVIQKKGNLKASAKPKKPKRLPGDRDSAIITQSVDPIYPKIALNYNYQGRIKLKLKLSYKGKILDYKIIQSTGHETLDQAFIRTVLEQYMFKPKRVMGRNKQSHLIVEYDFKL